MNRKVRRRKRQVDKAWEEVQQKTKDDVAAWMEERGLSREIVNQIGTDLERDIVEVIEYHRPPMELARTVLLVMVANSLAYEATNSDQLAADAALLGKQMVTMALEIFEHNEEQHP
jgi:hypothetical protein